jgi:hypothetical protein
VFHRVPERGPARLLPHGRDALDADGMEVVEVAAVLRRVRVVDLERTLVRVGLGVIRPRPTLEGELLTVSSGRP